MADNTNPTPHPRLRPVPPLADRGVRLRSSDSGSDPDRSPRSMDDSTDESSVSASDVTASEPRADPGLAAAAEPSDSPSSSSSVAGGGG